MTGNVKRESPPYIKIMVNPHLDVKKKISTIPCIAGIDKQRNFKPSFWALKSRSILFGMSTVQLLCLRTDRHARHFGDKILFHRKF